MAEAEAEEKRRKKTSAISRHDRIEPHIVCTMEIIYLLVEYLITEEIAHRGRS